MKNIVTKKEYQGHNIDRLHMVAYAMGYNSDEWGTFLQYKNLGYKVKKGEKGVQLNKYGKKEIVKDKKSIEQSYRKTFTVFNKEQVEKVA